MRGKFVTARAILVAQNLPQRLQWDTATEHQMLSATFATLEFTTQKNAVRGEVIGQGRSGSPHFCPVKSIARRLIHLRRHGASSTTPLASYYNGTKFCPIKPADISDVLRLATTALGTAYGFTCADISARSLRASGAMALLNGGVDTDIIRLIGRWRSDEMLRYLHVKPNRSCAATVPSCSPVVTIVSTQTARSRFANISFVSPTRPVPGCWPRLRVNHTKWLLQGGFWGKGTVK